MNNEDRCLKSKTTEQHTHDAALRSVYVCSVKTSYMYVCRNSGKVFHEACDGGNSVRRR